MLTSPFLGLCVSLESVGGKMADWIRMPFEMMSRVGRGMGVLEGGDCRRGRGSFGSEFVASHCNQWGLCCIVVWKCVNRLSCHLCG